MTCTKVLLMTSLVLAGCGGTQETIRGGAVTDECKSVPKLLWKETNYEKNVDRTIAVGADLAASAKNDIAKAKSVSFDVGATMSAEFANVVNQTFKVSGSVNPKFWEQDLTYRQTICAWDVQSRRTDITALQKDKFIEQMQDFAKLRIEYMFEVEKKTGKQ